MTTEAENLQGKNIMEITAAVREAIIQNHNGDALRAAKEVLMSHGVMTGNHDYFITEAARGLHWKN